MVELLVSEVRVGGVRPLGAQRVPSGIRKHPVPGLIAATDSGLDGDEQGDRQNHGGPDKAIHAYAAAHYSSWGAVLPDLAAQLKPGAFGENLVVNGAVEADICLGDRWRLGSTLLEVSQTRQPCWRLNLRFGRPDMARLVQSTGRTGWYFRVLGPGHVAPGQTASPRDPSMSGGPMDPAPLPLVVSIQSQVAWGHVGNSAAAPVMRACGVDVVEVPTTLLSNHPHYQTMRGRVLDSELVAEILAGLVERGVHTRAAVVLSGFMGKADTASAVAAFIRQVKAANPQVTYACDPVMGDTDIGYFADPTLQTAFRHELVPLADIILPNAFELSALSGVDVTRAEAVSDARIALGCRAITATSVPVQDRPNRLATVTSTAAGRTAIEVDRLPVRPAGSGDLFSGLTVARLALGLDLDAAVARAVAGVAAALERTSREPWAEMPIAAALDAIVTSGAQG